MPKNKTVLIVEDDPFTLKLYAYRFREEGFTVVQTPQASDVLHLAKTHKPQLFIVDIMLQDGNGFEIIKKLRAVREFKKTPIIVLSNLGQEQDVHEALRLGADDYFVKSNTRLEEVFEIIEKTLKKAKPKKRKPSSSKKKKTAA